MSRNWLRMEMKAEDRVDDEIPEESRPCPAAEESLPAGPLYPPWRISPRRVGGHTGWIVRYQSGTGRRSQTQGTVNTREL